jgi:hypothetical protein
MMRRRATVHVWDDQTELLSNIVATVERAVRIAVFVPIAIRTRAVRRSRIGGLYGRRNTDPVTVPSE